MQLVGKSETLHLLSKSFKASSIPFMCDRVVLYSDANLEIRVHMFVQGAKETFIHDHQSSFISYCMQGAYKHKLHSVVPSPGKHYVQYRFTGGIYTKEVEEKDGKLENILAQPFQVGQV
jgi:hypothetical protein